MTSPWNSLSTPATMRINVDLPAPLTPMTPIFASLKKESEIPLRSSLPFGRTFLTFTRFITMSAMRGGMPELGAAVQPSAHIVWSDGR